MPNKLSTLIHNFSTPSPTKDTGFFFRLVKSLVKMDNKEITYKPEGYPMPQKIKDILSRLEMELKTTNELDKDEKEQLGNSVSLIREKLELDNEAIIKNMGDDLEKLAIKYEETLPTFSSLVNKLTQSLTALGM